MKAVVQRVLKSELSIDDKLYSNINEGLLVLLGVTESDTEEDMKALADKIIKLRIFNDENDKMNLSVQDIGGEMQIVSQFTLYADCHKGNRPSFTEAAHPEKANKLYEQFVEYCKQTNLKIVTGEFGAHMHINFINNGPVTIILEAQNGKVI